MINQGRRKQLCAALLKSSMGFLAAVLFLTLASEASARKYIVKIKAPKTSNRGYSLSVRGLNTQYVKDELEQNVTGVDEARGLERSGFVIVESHNEVELQDALKRNPLVEYYEPDIEWKLNALSPDPSDNPVNPWLKDIMGMPAATPDAELINTSSNPTIVAVIDTGTNLSHPYIVPALAKNTTEFNGVSGLDDDGNGYVDDIYGANVFTLDGNANDVGTDHGSHVSGLVKTIRDQAIALGYSQARSVVVLPIRFIDGAGVGSTSGAIAALDYAESRGAKVVNCSWGAKGVETFSQALYDKMAELYTNYDITILVAAGNSEHGLQNDNDSTPYFPSSFNVPSLLSVASITPEFQSLSGNTTLVANGLSSFSNYGKSAVHIAAPGSFRDVSGDETGVWSVNADYTSSSDYYIKKKGTSMATPIVSGVAGVIRAINPTLTAFEVKKLIIDHGTVMSSLANYVSSSSYVSASKAFAAASTAVTRGLRPAVPPSPYSVSSDSGTSSSNTKRSGGCGLLAPLNPSDTEGPFGGNSLGLVLTLYGISLVSRSIYNRKKKHT